MSVKITGIKKLDANVYNKIIIREVDGNYFVNVNGEKLKDGYEAVSYKLSDGFKKVNDVEKIIMIVNSFLENTKIDSIDMLVGYVNYSGGFIKIDGTRQLYLQVKNEELIKIIFKMIKDKYDRDRSQYCLDNNESNSYNVILDEKVTSYNREFISCQDCSLVDCGENCPKYIEFKLLYRNGEIVKFDKEFIVRFVMDKLWEIGKEACIFVKEKDIMTINGCFVGRYVDAYYILCGDLSIRFSCGTFNKNYIFNLCDEIINRYNEELTVNNGVMKRQLKMVNF